MNTTIYMVRHAESPHIFGEERSRGLSEEGLEAAKKVAETMKNVEVHCVASSSYARAIQTVRYLAEANNLPIIEYDELIERPIMGLNYKAPWEQLFEAIKRSFTDIDYALEGGESTRAAGQRAIPVVQKLLQDYEGKNIVIGTHGNIMTIIMNYFDKSFGFEFWNGTSKPDIYRMTFVGDRLEKIDRVWESGQDRS
ncbi:histidine phosphatase family protein [Cohnella faecalis]|uniref:phosphoglycerate mutase (2,3-diphosphoglycerate-dependent) n=1 Tax=Cohnella faecalis TaxID=2315694 RepID=A0A398CQ43_9BACL|nr:histidine phosphatase family protein [Cohnella faecalis]RIE03419.1 histidine phosphatase family protein [Cohnella faecalis]